MNILILTHGAGSDRNAPMLVAVDAAFTAAGLEVIRYDLPFRQAHSGSPRRGDAERDRAGLKEQVLLARKKKPKNVWLGGHSYGGRQCSMLAAEEPGLFEKLLLMSYPLHTPGKPESMRTEHFPKIETPVLFVSGVRDAFGSIEEIKQAIQLIPARKQLLEIEKAGHDLGKNREAVAAQIQSAFTAL